MSVLGIIAEYDPFHRGHERHLRLAREAVQPDFTVIAMSACMKQRGEPAMLSPYDRAACALEAGADAVFALPTVWTMRDAEHYALGAVSMLAGLGATHLAFGAENADPEALWALARKLETPGTAFREALHGLLTEGHGYPRAMSLAMDREAPALGEILRKPNNILAVCYLRAILKTGAGLIPVPIPRNGAYRDETIHPEAPSAQALRDALARGNYGPAVEGLTEKSREAVRTAFLDGSVPREERMDTLLMDRLRSMTREEIRALPDVREGLEDRIREAARLCTGRRELIEAVSGRRYPEARISRICAWSLLGMTEERLRAEPLPEKAVLLGLRPHPELTKAWRSGRIQVTSEWEDETDLAAWRIRNLCAGLPDTLPWTEQVRKV